MLPHFVVAKLLMQRAMLLLLLGILIRFSKQNYITLPPPCSAICAWLERERQRDRGREVRPTTTHTALMTHGGFYFFSTAGYLQTQSTPPPSSLSAANTQCWFLAAVAAVVALDVVVVVAVGARLVRQNICALFSLSIIHIHLQSHSFIHSFMQ